MKRNKLLLLLVCFLGIQAMAKNGNLRYEDFLLRDTSRVIHGTLDNGFQYYIIKQPVNHLQMSLLQKTGFYDDAETTEISHFLEHMMMTANRVMATGDTLRSYLNKLGMDYGKDFNAYTTPNYMKFDLYGLKPELARADSCMDILSDIAGGASICTMDIEEQRERLLNEVSNRNYTFYSRVMDSFEAVFKFGHNPDEWRKMRLEGVRSITQSQLETFYRKWYHPQNQCLLVSGNIPEGVEDMIKRKFGKRPAIPTPASTTIDYNKNDLVIERQGKAECKIMLIMTQPLLTQSEKENIKLFRDCFALEKGCNTLRDNMMKNRNTAFSSTINCQTLERLTLEMDFACNINEEEADGGFLALVDSVTAFLHNVKNNGVQVSMPIDTLKKKTVVAHRVKAMKKLQEGDGRDNSIALMQFDGSFVYSLPLYKKEDTDAYWSYVLSGKDVSNYFKKFINKSAMKIECILPYDYPEKEITEKLKSLLRQYNN